MDKVELFSEESCEDNLHASAAIRVKDAIGEEELSTSKRQVQKIKKLLNSDLYKEFKDRLEADED